MKHIYVHPSATVETDHLGEGTKIWHRAHVRKGAIIGQDCILGKDVYVDEDVTIGNACKVQNGVSIYKGVILDSYVFVGPHVTFTNDKHPRAFGAWELVPTYIGRGASIGAHATIVCGVTLNPFCMVGSGAVVTRDVPSHAIVTGNPARIVGYACRHGHRMRQIQSVVHNGQAWKCDTCAHHLYIRAEYYDEHGISRIDWTPGMDPLPPGRTTEPSAGL